MIKLKLSRVNSWKKKGYTIGVANGCFDMLHPGHKKLNSLKEVDEIIVFKEKTSLKILKKIKPNYLFKSDEYKIYQISGKNF
jgi:bifunctional ADP-heptose synthase (sugar kinase/adenylyltransferase)